MRTYLVTTGPVFIPGPTVTVTGSFTVTAVTVAPVVDEEVCEDCGGDLSPLVDNEGKIRTIFCEPCEYGV